MAAPAKQKKRTDIAADSPPEGVRVWGEVSITVNLGDYESAKVTLGEARTCEDTEEDRKVTRQDILATCERAVVRKAERVRKIWKEKA